MLLRTHIIATKINNYYPVFSNQGKKLCPFHRKWYNAIYCTPLLILRVTWQSDNLILATMMETMLPLILIVILLAHLINKEFVKEGCLSRMLLKLFKVFHGKMSFHPFSGDSKNAKLVGPMIIDILPKNCFAISIHLFWILDAVCS